MTPEIADLAEAVRRIQGTATSDLDLQPDHNRRTSHFALEFTNTMKMPVNRAFTGPILSKPHFSPYEKRACPYPPYGYPAKVTIQASWLCYDARPKQESRGQELPATDVDWSRTLASGHIEIDAQHKRLLLLCEAVVESLVNSPENKPHAEKLQSLIDFAKEHFEFEEHLMRSTAYPGANQHAKSHASLLKELRAYAFNMQQGQDINPVGLISYVWFTLHIEAADRDLVAWLKSRSRRS